LPSFIQNANNFTKVNINREPTVRDKMFNLIIHEDIFVALKQVKQFLH